jgi:hypothetical protein
MGCTYKNIGIRVTLREAWVGGAITLPSSMIINVRSNQTRELSLISPRLKGVKISANHRSKRVFINRIRSSSESRRAHRRCLKRFPRQLFSGKKFRVREKEVLIEASKELLKKLWS